jgi:hypothetical protein
MAWPTSSAPQGSSAWVQFAASLICLVPVVWVGHAYVAHESDTVSPILWAGYVLVVGILWGPLLILTAAVVSLVHPGSRVARWLGIVGGTLASAWYLFGLWTFSFRYPPHWTLYAGECAATVAAITALVVALRRARAAKLGTLV